MSNETQTTKIVIPARFSYLHAWEPTSMDEDQEKKYSVSLIIPKSDTASIAKINKIIESIKDTVKAKNNGKLPAKFQNPLRDGDVDRAEDDAYADSYFINAKSKQQPGIVGADRSPIINKEELYSGCYGYASITFYAFDKAGNKGIGAGLNNLMKTKDGESLGGRASAESDFAGIEVEDDLLG